MPRKTTVVVVVVVCYLQCVLFLQRSLPARCAAGGGGGDEEWRRRVRDNVDARVTVAGEASDRENYVHSVRLAGAEASGPYRIVAYGERDPKSPPGTCAVDRARALYAVASCEIRRRPAVVLPVAVSGERRLRAAVRAAVRAGPAGSRARRARAT